MSVVAGTVLQTRRLHDLYRRRERLAERQEEACAALPDWAMEPLRLVGMSSAEVTALVSDLSEREQEEGIAELEMQMADIDREIDGLEAQLARTPSTSVEGIEAVLSLAVEQMRAFTVRDPSDVFYDHGEARVLALVERALTDARALLNTRTARAG
ncbi:MAG: hypothetical protein ACFB3T_15935 [Geminicoccaceae bacterium]